jgi:hypothetical protein
VPGLLPVDSHASKFRQGKVDRKPPSGSRVVEMAGHGATRTKVAQWRILASAAIDRERTAGVKPAAGRRIQEPLAVLILPGERFNLAGEALDARRQSPARSSIRCNMRVTEHRCVSPGRPAARRAGNADLAGLNRQAKSVGEIRVVDRAGLRLVAEAPLQRPERKSSNVFRSSWVSWRNARAAAAPSPSCVKIASASVAALPS